MTPIKRLALELDKIREYSELSDVSEIARRYFAMNAFDGILTIIGMLIGSYVARISNPAIILTTGMSTALAMGVSGLWGAALTETAERKRSLHELEAATLCELGETKLAKASRVAVVVVSAADSLAPVASSVLVLLPFFLVSLLPNIQAAYYLSLILGLTSLFALGIFLGRISKQNLLASGLKTVSAGIASIVIGLVLSTGGHV